jgi:hypothetical protein
MKGMPLDTVHDDLVHALGTEVMADATVTKYAGSANFVPKRLGLITSHLRWIPHTLTADQKSERVGYSRQLLAILEQQ